MREFYELKELTMYLKESNVSRYDKKVLCDYYNDNEGFQDEAFILISEEETVQEQVDQMIGNETLVYFNSSFLARYTDLDIEVLKALQSLEYKGNDALVKIFEDQLEEMAYDAIQEDGAGHFLNHYDGSYEEILINNEIYYFTFN